MANEIEASVNGQTVKLKYKPNKVRTAILSSIATKALIRAKAERIAKKANAMYGAKGYRVRIKQGQTRARAYVYTGDLHSMRSNRIHNTLQKALGGGK
ncbi:hypothetical protein HMPREF3192_00933 [Atopobium deltae]|uniref:Phage protein n=1 Tax=Atopobium deltae TaxID=1393034 RepID=A0A133XTX3_9ACTN|nr:hypothetical protein HMPREF3192_00933 [Atopobium deltae]